MSRLQMRGRDSRWRHDGNLAVACVTRDRAKIVKRQLRRSDVRGSVARSHDRAAIARSTFLRRDPRDSRSAWKRKRGIHDRDSLPPVYVTAGVNEVRSPATRQKLAARRAPPGSVRDVAARHSLVAALLLTVAGKEHPTMVSTATECVRFACTMQKRVDRRVGTTSMRLNESVTCVCSQASYSEDQLAGKWRATVTAARPREARDCE